MIGGRMMPAGGDDRPYTTCPCGERGTPPYDCPWCGRDLRCTCHGATSVDRLFGEPVIGLPCGPDHAENERVLRDVLVKSREVTW